VQPTRGAARFRSMHDRDAAAEDALFQIEGPDDEGWVWACSPEGREIWCQNLGQKDAVAEALSQWLASLDDAEEP
jgi:hypothetical protein